MKLAISTILLLSITQIKANSRLLQQTACTADAKRCPDGSFVGRTGPNCEFAACPPCEVAPCLIPPCPCITCPGDDRACLNQNGQCDVLGNCFADPCQVSNTCKSNEICKADYCGGCNVKCEPDCSVVRCAKPDCKGLEKPVIPDGECCAQCQLDCSAVLCLKPECEDDEEIVVPDGQCCGVCQRADPQCAEGQEFSQCARCPATCIRPFPICLAVCRPGCQCPRETPIYSALDGKCITLDECTKPCEKNGDCTSDYKCRNDPRCKDVNDPNDHVFCAKRKICFKSGGNCASDAECEEGYQCVNQFGNGICVDFE